MVDSNDRERILEARDELHRMLSEVSSFHSLVINFSIDCESYLLALSIICIAG